MIHDVVFPWWTSPPNLIWDVTADCVLFGNFAHSIIRTSPDLNYCAVDINALYSLVKSSPNNGSVEAVATWYLSGCGPYASDTSCYVDTCLGAVSLRDAVRSEIDKSANMTCIGELRSSLGIHGNADVAGVGVMVTFCIEAWLVASFLAAKVAKYVRDHSLEMPDWLDATYQHLLDTFQVILPAFYWSSVLLSLGIVAASVLTAAAASGDGQGRQLEEWRAGEDYTVYDSQLSSLASLFSIQATFMASLMLQERGRPLRLLNLAIFPILAFLGVLLVALLGLTVWYVANLPRNVNLLLPDTLGKDQTVKIFLLVSVSVTISMMVTCGVTVGLIAYLSRAKKGQTEQGSTPSAGELSAAGQAKASPAQNRDMSLHQLLAAEFRIVLAITMGMMLATLGMLFEFRKQTINSGAADDPQLEWSFGQIAVMTTWAPVVLHFWCALAVRVGIIPALERRMPAGSWIVRLLKLMMKKRQNRAAMAEEV